LVLITVGVPLLVTSPASTEMVLHENWAARYDFPPAGSWDTPTHVSVDAQGCVYVAGAAGGVPDSYAHDYLILKYSSAGSLLWPASYDGTGHGDDQPSDMVLRPGGGVYVTGISRGESTRNDCFTVAYDDSGDVVWESRYDGEPHAGDAGYACSNHPGGGVIVVGVTCNGQEDGCDCLAVLYEQSGTESWVATYDGPDGLDDYAKAVAADTSGTVYVAGYSRGPLDDYDLIALKYDTDGELQWTYRYGYSVGGDDAACAIAVGPHGRVLVAGTSCGPDSGEDYVIVCLSADGSEQWVARYDGLSSDSDKCYAMAVDDSGNVYVTGLSYDVGTAIDFLTIKYNSSGAQIWTARYDGQYGGGADSANDIVVDADGRVIVAGSAAQEDWSGDLTVVVYGNDGSTLATVARDVAGHYDDANAVALSGDGDIVVTGPCRTQPWGPNEFLTIRYTLWQDEGVTADGLQVYPSPSCGRVYFATKAVPPWETYTVDIYDLAGRHVKALAATEGGEPCSWSGTTSSGGRVAAGIYFARLSSPSTETTAKVVVLR